MEALVELAWNDPYKRKKDLSRHMIPLLLCNNSKALG